MPRIVQQPYLTRRRRQRRIFPPIRRGRRLIKPRAQRNHVIVHRPLLLSLYLEHGISQVTINLAEIFLLPAPEQSLVTSRRKSKEQRKINNHSQTDRKPGDPRQSWFAREPENHRRRDRRKCSQAGRQESQHHQWRRKIHIARRTGGSTKHLSRSQHYSPILLIEVRIDLICDPVILDQQRQQHSQNPTPPPEPPPAAVRP